MKLSHRVLFFVVPAAISALAIACTGASTEDSGASDSDLTGSIDRERRCAAAHAYDDAELSDLSTLASSSVLPSIKAAVGEATVSSLDVAGLGPIYIAPSGGRTALFDRNGNLLITGAESPSGMRWLLNTGSPLVCDTGWSSSSSSTGGWGVPEGGPWTGSSTSSSGGWHYSPEAGAEGGHWSGSSTSSSSGGWHYSPEAGVDASHP